MTPGQHCQTQHHSHPDCTTHYIYYLYPIMADALSQQLHNYYKLRLIRQMRLQMPAIVHIDDNIYIGNYGNITDKAQTAPLSFHVLFTDIDYSPALLKEQLSIEQVVYLDRNRLSEELSKTIALLDAALKQQKNILITCLTGKVFSPFLIICYLVQYFEYEQGQAISVLEEKLGKLTLTPQQLGLLNELSALHSVESVHNDPISLDNVQSYNNNSYDTDNNSIFSSQIHQKDQKASQNKKSHFFDQLQEEMKPSSSGSDAGSDVRVSINLASQSRTSISQIQDNKSCQVLEHKLKTDNQISSCRQLTRNDKHEEEEEEKEKEKEEEEEKEEEKEKAEEVNEQKKSKKKKKKNKKPQQEVVEQQDPVKEEEKEEEVIEQQNLQEEEPKEEPKEVEKMEEPKVEEAKEEVEKMEEPKEEPKEVEKMEEPKVEEAKEEEAKEEEAKEVEEPQKKSKKKKKKKKN